ncbi:MAG: type 4a pilus biogenesis protein PilO [Deltaproteobacteria bacterium]|nr:type 4a pilus biogenesis protein PilO [Deltaproteobacteria bacterium]
MAITLDDIKKMPPKRKGLIILVFFLLLGGIDYSLFLQSSIETKGTLETKLSEIQVQVTEKERLAAQKEKYVREVNALRETLRIALTKLPDQREIPGLLYAVAQAGKDSGIDFILFEPKQSEKKPPVTQPAGAKPPDKKAPDTKGAAPKQVEEKFYDEIPVKVTVTGGFHSIVVFFEKVAKLPRIINIEDISMSDGKDIKGRGRYINTSCMIKTYMFLEKLDEKKADEKK